MRIISIIGYSGSGKTTLAEGLIRELVRRGRAVAAIKHTHHPVDSINRGDTLRYLRAGASAAVLIGADQAYLWTKDAAPEQLAEADPLQVAHRLSTEWLLIEGYKDSPIGAAIALQMNGGESVAKTAKNVVRVLADGFTQKPEDLAELVTFLDKITRP